MQDLWAELNNEQSLPASTGHGQEPLRHRRLAEQAILAALRDWLLHDYVAPYCAILSTTRIYRHCYWIDALGSITLGTNSKTTTSTLQPIVSLADTLAQQSKPIALHGIVLEAGSSKRKETRATESAIKDTVGEMPSQGERRDPIYRVPRGGAGSTPLTSPTKSAKDAKVFPKASGIVHASWLEIAPDLLTLIDQSPAIFLLNPFGHTMFLYDDLAPLYQRTAPTELCLLISHKQVTNHLVAAKNLAPARVTSPLTALLRTDRWKSLPISSDKETEQAVERVIELFIASMQRHFLSVQRLTLPMQVRPALVETVPYTLIFATRRQDSLATMNDVICLYRRRLSEQSHRGVLAEAWFATQQQQRLAEEMQQLHQRVLQQGRTQRTRRWPDLRQQLLTANFGQYTLHDYDTVIQRLLANGDIRCEWRRKPGAPEESCIPGNDDLLLWK